MLQLKQNKLDEKVIDNEHEIEKAKIQDSIQKNKFELRKDNESEFRYKEATKKEQANYQADMWDLSHQICQSCRLRMRSCPQCREQYRKHKRRHKEKEEISQQLQALYKTLQQHLETL